MSANPTAMLLKGFQISKEEYDNLSPEFRHEWTNQSKRHNKDFYFVGYIYTFCSIDEVAILNPEDFEICPSDKRLIADCEEEGLEVSRLRFYLKVVL